MKSYLDTARYMINQAHKKAIENLGIGIYKKDNIIVTKNFDTGTLTVNGIELSHNEAISKIMILLGYGKDL